MHHLDACLVALKRRGVVDNNGYLLPGAREQMWGIDHPEMYKLFAGSYVRALETVPEFLHSNYVGVTAGEIIKVLHVGGSPGDEGWLWVETEFNTQGWLWRGHVRKCGVHYPV